MYVVFLRLLTDIVIVKLKIVGLWLLDTPVRPLSLIGKDQEFNKLNVISLNKIKTIGIILT
jgi:hypothetical protein